MAVWPPFEVSVTCVSVPSHVLCLILCFPITKITMGALGRCSAVREKLGKIRV